MADHFDRHTTWSPWAQVQAEVNPPHQFEERRERWAVYQKSERMVWQFRCVSCKRFVGKTTADYCKNDRCHVPVLIELLDLKSLEEEV